MNKNNHITHSVAHYLTTIHKLYESDLRSKCVDIASYLNIAKSSVNLAVKKLKEKNLIGEDDRRNLYLTKLGHKHVHNVLASRSLVYYLLKSILGVNIKDAEKDACKIEHLLCKDSQKKLFKFLKKISNCNKEDIKKFDLDICLCDFKSFSEFTESQVGDEFLISVPNNKCK